MLDTWCRTLVHRYSSLNLANVFPVHRSVYKPSMESGTPTTTRPKSTSKRRSRMLRQKTGKQIQLTSRDLEILRLLSRYRYLRSTHLHALTCGKSHNRFVERLGDLYHELCPKVGDGDFRRRVL